MVTNILQCGVTVAKNKELTVYKRDDMIQRSRFDLTLREQRLVLFAISKIKPHDTSDTLYEFNMRDMCKIIGTKDESYTRIKSIAKTLSDKSWWVLSEDNVESLVRWFSVFKIDYSTNTIMLKFHEEVMPYLVELVKQHKYYTSYGIGDILPMRHQSSPRLYEILKSYSKNNCSWYFDAEQLKYLMNCQNYSRWVDFKRRILEPAVEEINNMTPMIVKYETISECRKVIGVKFYMNDVSGSLLI